jgi:hypothetical protein
VDFVAKDLSVVKWCFHYFRTLLKKSSVEVWEPYRTDLERVAFRMLDKPRRAIGKYKFNFIDEQSINALSFAYNVM